MQEEQQANAIMNESQSSGEYNEESAMVASDQKGEIRISD